SSGGTASAALLNGANGLLFVSSGGTTIGDVLLGDDTTFSFADELVFSGGVASNATISNRGVLVLSGGTAIGTVVNSNTGLQWTGSGAMVVSSGGVASGTVVNSGGLINVRSSGTEIGGIVSAGGFIGVGTNNLSGTTIGDTLIGSGNVFAVERVSRGAV